MRTAGRYLYLGWVAAILLFYINLYRDLFPAILNALGIG